MSFLTTTVVVAKLKSDLFVVEAMVNIVLP
jgi:hypothetical protein